MKDAFKLGKVVKFYPSACLSASHRPHPHYRLQEHTSSHTLLVTTNALSVHKHCSTLLERTISLSLSLSLSLSRETYTVPLHCCKPLDANSLHQAGAHGEKNKTKCNLPNLSISAATKGRQSLIFHRHFPSGRHHLCLVKSWRQTPILGHSGHVFTLSQRSTLRPNS